MITANVPTGIGNAGSFYRYAFIHIGGGYFFFDFYPIRSRRRSGRVFLNGKGDAVYQ
jgi:hypothetical protein